MVRINNNIIIVSSILTSIATINILRNNRNKRQKNNTCNIKDYNDYINNIQKIDPRFYTIIDNIIDNKKDKDFQNQNYYRGLLLTYGIKETKNNFKILNNSFSDFKQHIKEYILNLEILDNELLKPDFKKAIIQKFYDTYFLRFKTNPMSSFIQSSSTEVWGSKVEKELFI